MLRSLLAAFVLLIATSANAITLEEAQQAAHQWVVARQDVIMNRVEDCITEGNPRPCHTGWAASVVPNTAPADSSLATVTLDDPGHIQVTCCGTCPLGTGSFAQAGIAIPATAPLNAKLDIAGSGPGVRDPETGTFNWGVQLRIRIRYDGILYERGYGKGFFSGFPWREVEE